MESRISRFKRRMRCDIDGGRCTKCGKCEHLPKEKSNLLNKLLISILIIVILIFVLHPILQYEVAKATQINEEPTHNSDTSYDQVPNYDISNSYNEPTYQDDNQGMIGTIGDNYNSMG